VEGQPGRSLPVERLRRHAQGLLCLSGGENSWVTTLLRAGQADEALRFLGALRDVFAGRLYVEVQRRSPGDRTMSQELVTLAGRADLPLVATHDIYIMRPEQAGLQRLAAAIRLNQRVAELEAHQAAPAGAHWISPAEMQARFADLPAALAASVDIAERCQLELPLGQPHYPEIPLPPGVTPEQVLRSKAVEGARRLYGAISPELRERLEHELMVIEECGYAALFLVMEEILQFARQRGVPFSSRGSAASSLVAHCLGITSPDPLGLNLYFERFLNPARATPPDIDTDLCSRRRDEVIRHVYEHYGQERVAMVCTINRFRRRSALREAAKAHGLPPEQIKILADGLPYRWYGPPSRQENADRPYADLEEQYPASHYQALFRDAAALLGLPRHLSIHPGGVVIGPGPLTDVVPLMLATKGVVITQFDLDSIESLGLVKVDLLGIRGLTVLGDVAEAVCRQTAEQPGGGCRETALEVLDTIPEDDPRTAEMVQNGRTIGCFQIESPGMRATLKEIQAHSVDDLMVALALYRPGPLTGGLKDAFVRRHRGEEPVTHLHEALRPLLADTYGVILYQEQVLRIAHELAGISLADADLLRRAMSHFDPGKQMQTLEEKFIAGALERNGVPESVAERVWELMAAFAGYGFPKAHAASYAQVAWRAAWCKQHHPAVFMAAVLANWGGYYSQRVYLMEARRLGLSLHPPHVNYARREFSVSYLQEQPALFMGLDQVRDLTRRTQERIIRLRPFTTLHDFLARVDPRQVEAENLARAGALGGFGPIPALLRQLHHPGWRGGQMALFALDEQAEEDWSLEEKVAAQEALLGVGIEAHPLELVASRIAAAGALTTLEAAARLGQRVRVAGMRQIWRRSRGGRADYIYYMSLEDLEGMLEVVIAGEVYRHNRKVFSGPGPYVIEGVVELDASNAEPFIRAERVWGLN